ncbi:citrate-binding protein-like [Fagus crenata]
MNNYFYYRFLLVVLVVVGSLEKFSLCGAQLDPTEGFSLVPLTDSNFELQKPYDIPLEQRYSFVNGVHRLWVYADDKPHDPQSQTQPRTEIRIKLFSLHPF